MVGGGRRRRWRGRDLVHRGLAAVVELRPLVLVPGEHTGREGGDEKAYGMHNHVIVCSAAVCEAC